MRHVNEGTAACATCQNKEQLLVRLVNEGTAACETCFKKETVAFLTFLKKHMLVRPVKKRTKTEHLLRRLVKEGSETFQRVTSSSPPLPSASCLSFVLSLSVCRRSSLLTGEGGRGQEPDHTTARMHGPL